MMCILRDREKKKKKGSERKVKTLYWHGEGLPQFEFADREDAVFRQLPLPHLFPNTPPLILYIYIIRTNIYTN